MRVLYKGIVVTLLVVIAAEFAYICKVLYPGTEEEFNEDIA